MKLERGVPAPISSDANARVHRVDAEAEEFMKAHAAGIIDAWRVNGDPANYPAWDSEAIRKHWPELWTRWRNMHQAKDRLGTLLMNERQRLILDPGSK